jgi:hypothetical protein
MVWVGALSFSSILVAPEHSLHLTKHLTIANRMLDPDTKR